MQKPLWQPIAGTTATHFPTALVAPDQLLADLHRDAGAGWSIWTDGRKFRIARMASRWETQLVINNLPLLENRLFDVRFRARIPHTDRANWAAWFAKCYGCATFDGHGIVTPSDGSLLGPCVDPGATPNFDPSIDHLLKPTDDRLAGDSAILPSHIQALLKRQLPSWELRIDGEQLYLIGPLPPTSFELRISLRYVHGADLPRLSRMSLRGEEQKHRRSADRMVRLIWGYLVLLLHNTTARGIYVPARR